MAHIYSISHAKRAPSFFTVQVSDRGRLVLPAEVRERLGLKPGDRLILTLEADDSLRLVSPRTQIREARGLYADLAAGRHLVDELLAERRQEADEEAGD
jgi:AbrB family looped-hinge helix DNA binding protein